MLDPTDLNLLRHLSKDASATATQLSDRLHLSPSQISRRRARLESEGYISGTHAALDARKLGLTVQAFVQVSMARHSAQGAQSFHTMVQAQPEVVSMWTLTGEADYLLRVFCTDLAALNDLVHQVLLPQAAVDRVQTRIVMDQVKRDAPLPL